MIRLRGRAGENRLVDQFPIDRIVCCGGEIAQGKILLARSVTSGKFPNVFEKHRKTDKK